MPRIPVPDDYPTDHIVVAGTADYHYPEADVQVDDDHARTLQVREDDEGRYCGPPEQHADAVRAFLGVDVTDSSFADEETSEVDSDAEQDSVTCDAVKADGEVCGRELPCPYHSEGDD